MQTIEEFKEYTAQLEGEVKNWRDAYNASQEHIKQLMKENQRLERERVEQNAIIETCACELEELRKHELEWDLDKAKIKELTEANTQLTIKCKLADQSVKNCNQQLQELLDEINAKENG